MNQIDQLGTALWAGRVASRIHDTETVKCFGWLVNGGLYHVRRFTKTGDVWLVEFTQRPIGWEARLTSTEYVEASNG